MSRMEYSVFNEKTKENEGGQSKSNSKSLPYLTCQIMLPNPLLHHMASQNLLPLQQFA
jgi:hypothetical protein